MQTRKWIQVSRSTGVVLAVLLGPLSRGESPEPSDVSGIPGGTTQAGRISPDEKEKAYWLLRAHGGASIPADAYDRAGEQWRRLPKAALSEAKAVTGVNGTTWRPIGPSPMIAGISGSGTNFVNGRTHAIAVHPYNPNVIYQGLNIGGVWKTINGGKTWTPLFDQQIAMGIGQPSAMAIDPNNADTVYVGTNPRFQQSQGIFKSTDGGASWIVLGSGFPANNIGNAQSLFINQHVSAIIVDPANSSLLYLAANNGLFRSTDGGRNWTNGINGSGGPRVNFAQSLVIDPTSPAGSRILYAGIDGSGVRRSTNGGLSWTQILSAATPAVSTAVSTGSFQRVTVALAPPTAPPNPNGIQVIYVVLSGSGGAPDPVGIFESTDQGTNWVQRVANVPAFNTLMGGTQSGFNLELGVDPGSPGDGANDILYLGCVSQARSTDSGANFSSIENGLHADTRAGWVFYRPPGGPTAIWTGNDGGIYRSTDGGAHWTGTGEAGAPETINGGGLQTAMVFHMDVKRDGAASDTLISLQDNGSAVTTGIPLWTIRTGGDGFDVVWDFINTNTAFEVHNVSGSLNGIFQSTDGAGSFGNFTDGIVSTDVAIFGTTGFNVVNVDPQNAGFLYVSGSSNGLWQAQGGGTFNRIQTFPGGVGAVDVAPANSNNLVAVVSGTRVFVSTDVLAATPTFTEITGNLPGRTVMQVAFDPNDPTVVYATLSGFNSQTPGQNGHIFRRRITGGNWTDISPALDVPFDAIALDGVATPTAIYAGTDLGVIRSVDGGASWTVLDDLHFPNLPVNDLKINAQAQVLRAATFGRGVFEFSSPNGPVIAVNAQNNLDFGLGCAGVVEYLTIQVFNVGTSDLIINSVSRLMGSSDFTVLPNPATPLLVSPNSEVDFTVRYTPTTPGPQQATIRIASNDPNAPYVDLTATGTGTNAVIATLIADSGSFGDVCVGSFRDLDLTINNSGACDLIISNITFSPAGQFLIPWVVSYPLVVHPGDTLTVPLRFQPTTIGFKSSQLRISSNDPTTPVATLNLTGNAPSGDVRVVGSGDFGEVCPGTQAEKTISICNVGKCNLTVTNVSFVQPCPDFTLINNPFPAAVSPDFCLGVVVRFTPTSCGTKLCILQILTDDPDTPVIQIIITANTPCPDIDVPPDLGFLPEVIQTAGNCSTALPFPISNKGDCNLVITNIWISGTNAGDFSMSGLPSFPIILEPGHIVGEGDFNVVFAPTAIARERRATINVTYISDPFTGATTTITRELCGEGVLTGARVLVMHAGVPVDFVERIHLQRVVGNRNKPQLDTTDVARDLPLVTVIPDPPCEPFQYHREYGTVSNPIQLLPGTYQVTASAIINGKHKNWSVGFDVTTCDFNPTVVVNFP